MGFNSTYQLSVGDNDNKNRPTEISFAHLNLAPDDKIKEVFIREHHPAYSTEQGCYFACGRDITFRAPPDVFRINDKRTKINYKNPKLTHVQKVQIMNLQKKSNKYLYY